MRVEFSRQIPPFLLPHASISTNYLAVSYYSYIHKLKENYFLPVNHLLIYWVDSNICFSFLYTLSFFSAAPCFAQLARLEWNFLVSWITANFAIMMGYITPTKSVWGYVLIYYVYKIRVAHRFLHKLRMCNVNVLLGATSPQWSQVKISYLIYLLYQPT